MTLPYPHELGPGAEAHRPAAEALRDRLGWTGDLIAGYMPDGRYAFVFGPECPEPERCAACGDPMYGMVRVHHHSENGVDATR